MLPKPDTIAAIATAQGRGGIGVIRVSGSKVPDIARKLLGNLPAPRYAHYCEFPDEHGQAIDQGIALYFVAPHSYTGEDVLELQGHGGTAVLQLILQRCLELGARLAEPGEYTRRAYINNKIDLLQAESVADLIAATSIDAARSAMRTLQGDFSKAIYNLVNDLIALRMLIEAMLDFPEEEIDSLDVSRRDTQLTEIQDELQRTLEIATQGRLLREGAHVALIGQPNVGKSSLLNCLSGEDVALVSDIAGTTRDVIRQAIQICGVPFHIMDTAGLRESQDAVEKMGMARTHHTLNRADLILLLVDASEGITPAGQAILSSLPIDIPHLLVYNKSDLVAEPQIEAGPNSIHISAKTGAGIEELRSQLLRRIGWQSGGGGEFMARERHLQALKLAQSHLIQAEAVITRPELFAEELRQAQSALSSITGEFSADDLLGEIFSRFCIGK